MTTSPQSMEAAGPKASPESRPNFWSAARELSCDKEAGGVEETDNCPNVPEEEKNIEKPVLVDDNLSNMACSKSLPKKEVEKIALSAIKKAEKILQSQFKSFCPLMYIRRRDINYCIRVRVASENCSNKILDLHCRYLADCTKCLNAKWVKDEDDQMTFKFPAQ